MPKALSKVLAEVVLEVALNASLELFGVNLLEFAADLVRGLGLLEVLMLELGDAFPGFFKVLILEVGDAFKELLEVEMGEAFPGLPKGLMLEVRDAFPETLMLGLAPDIFGLSEVASRLDRVDFEGVGSGGVGRIKYFTRFCKSLLNVS